MNSPPGTSSQGTGAAMAGEFCHGKCHSKAVPVLKQRRKLPERLGFVIADAGKGLMPSFSDLVPPAGKELTP